jgi:hypothetical protein
VEHTKKRGAKFYIGSNDAIYALDIIESEKEFHKLPKGEGNLIRSLLNICSESNEDNAHIGDITNRSELSEASIAVYADRLVKKGYLVKSKSALKAGVRGRSSNIYTLVDMEIFFGLKEGESDLINQADAQELAPQQRSLFDFQPEEADIYHQHPSLIMPGSAHRAEIFSIYTLLSVLRLGKTGNRAKGSFTTPAFIGDQTLRIHVAAIDGEKIAGIIDTKALIGLTTLARNYYANGKLSSDPLIIDMSDFTQYLDYKNDGGNRKQVWDMVNAWRQTSFKILSASKGLLDLYGEDLFEIDDFSFISRLKIVTAGKSETPLRFAVWFDSLFLSRVLAEHGRYLSLIHHEIMREKSAPRIMMYYWMRRAVQYKSVCYNPYTFDKLLCEMAPYMNSSQQFRNVLDSGLGTPIQGSKNRYKIYSYFIEVSDDWFEIDAKDYKKTEFKIWMDSKDMLARNYNKHQLASA